MAPAASVELPKHCHLTADSLCVTITAKCGGDYVHPFALPLSAAGRVRRWSDGGGQEGASVWPGLQGCVPPRSVGQPTQE